MASEPHHDASEPHHDAREPHHDDGLSDSRIIPRRALGRRALIFLSLGAVIGSGWLVAPLDAARLAGGSALIAWLLAAGLVLTLAFVHAELGTMFPVDGGTARFPLYAFGRVMGVFSGYFAWISAVCTTAIETEVALRYLSNYAGWMAHETNHVFSLTRAGQGVGVVIVAGFTVLNAGGLRPFRETNGVIVSLKVLALILVPITFMVYAFHPHNFFVGGFFAGGSTGLLTAISGGGVVFALMGFEQAVELGGETQSPQRSIPWALIGSVVVAGSLYVLLQFGFIASVPSSSLAHGWDHVSFPGFFGPLAGLAGVLGAGAIAYIIYTDAIISPGGTGLTFSATASRLPYALANEGYLPSWLGRVSRRGVPLNSLVVCFIANVAVIVIFPEWEQLLAFVTAATIFVYATAPPTLALLRQTAPGLRRPYRLRHARLTSPFSFVAANLILIWVGWTTDARFFSVIAGGMVLVAGLALVRRQLLRNVTEWMAASWLAPYIAGLAIISYLSPYGGQHVIPNDWASVLVVAAFSLMIYYLALFVGLAAHRRLPEGERGIASWFRHRDELAADNGDTSDSVDDAITTTVGDRRPDASSLKQEERASGDPS